MNTMNLEGELYGYKKKTLAGVVILILVAGVMFYAGAKYEKNKLLSLGFAKCEKAPKKTKTSKTTNDANITAPTTNETTPAPAKTTSPSETPATKITNPAIAPTGNLPK